MYRLETYDRYCLYAASKGNTPKQQKILDEGKTVYYIDWLSRELIKFAREYKGEPGIFQNAINIKLTKKGVKEFDIYLNDNYAIENK